MKRADFPLRGQKNINNFKPKKTQNKQTKITLFFFLVQIPKCIGLVWVKHIKIIQSISKLLKITFKAEVFQLKAILKH